MSGLFNHGSLKTIVFSISTPLNIILWLCSSFSDILTHTFLYEVSWLINTYIFYIIGIWMSKDSLVLCSMEYLNNMWPVLPSELFSQVYFTLFSKHQSLFPIKPITFVSTNSFFVARCILLFQLHHQPSSLLFDVKKVKYKQYFSISLCLILIYVVFFYQIFCTCRFRRGFIDIRRNIDLRLASFLCGKDRRGARLFQNISPKYLSIFPSMS